MHPLSARRSFLVVPALLALATAGFYLNRDSARAVSTQSSAPPPRPAVSQAAEKLDALRREPLSVQQSSALNPSTSEAATAPRFVTASLATTFPGLAAPSGNWRSVNPETLTVAPHADLPLTFTRTALKQEGPYTTWIGRNPALPGASLVTVATVDGYDAVLVLPSASQFSFHVRGAEVVITESVPGEEGCNVAPTQADRLAPPAAARNIVDVFAEVPLPPKADTTVVTTTTTFVPLTVDVLFAYDADTLTAATALSSDPVGYIDRQTKAKLESANLALAQSDVTNFTWRHLGVAAAPSYPRDETSARDLAALIDPTLLGPWVTETRYRRGADQVMLLVGGKADFAGIAYAPLQIPVTRSRAVASMRWTASYKTLAHELAHNFGCKHDRANATTTGNGAAADGDGYWAYGQMWDNAKLPPNYTGTSGTGGTIMSYADWIVPYFSNPGISLRVTGSTFGWSSNPDLGTHQLGRAETDPKAAYNARVLTDNSPAMAAIEEEITTPSITTQPQNTSVLRGGSFLLSVSASGGGLSFQWRRGGTDIAGATSSSYSKIVETDEPQSYSVVVSNLAGSVASNAVNITVTAPPPSPSTSSSSGGSGGGGGAPGLGCVLALVSLLGWRKRARN